MSDIEQRLAELGITLPHAHPAAGNYANAVRSGNLLFLSGKAPSGENGVLPKGRFGAEYDVEDGYRFARSAALQLLGVLQAELGSLARVARFVEIQGFLNTTADFEDHAKVLDGASDLLSQVFGERGVHARSVVGAHSLRGGVPLTVRGVVEVID
ncbi:RidA family protein [Andreprevotia chitinilytica]|uniref:RidA family protein n=1 Tax=Andreprevotia chitinilytica TaxID=396808 RepID=UPI000553CF85|nr:RidA family protein [Andreprevotia chitinilytica]